MVRYRYLDPRQLFAVCGVWCVGTILSPAVLCTALTGSGWLAGVGVPGITPSYHITPRREVCATIYRTE